MPRVSGFLRRHFVPPSPFGIIVIGFFAAILTGLVGAAIWTSSNTAQVRQTIGFPTPSVLPTVAESTLQTTTTRPDLSVDAMHDKLSPLVWSISTLDAAGQPAEASAFPVGSSGRHTFLITSLDAVQAPTREPAPQISATNGTFSGPAELWTWQEDLDLALLAVDRQRVEQIPWAPVPVQLKTGDRIFAISALGDKKVTPGVVTAAGAGVIQHNVFVDNGRRGGPLVNVKGEVVGISSAAFTGGGTPTDAAFFSVPIYAICDQLISCPGIRPPEEAPSADEGNTGPTTTTSPAPERRQPATTATTGVSGDPPATDEGPPDTAE